MCVAVLDGSQTMTVSYKRIMIFWDCLVNTTFLLRASVLLLRQSVELVPQVIQNLQTRSKLSALYTFTIKSSVSCKEDPARLMVDKPARNPAGRSIFVFP